MGRDQKVIEIPEFIFRGQNIRGRVSPENIDRCSSDPAFFQGTSEGLFIEDLTPGDID
jgi:hypothetical protein